MNLGSTGLGAGRAGRSGLLDFWMGTAILPRY
jgi:hypothetical protein